MKTSMSLISKINKEALLATTSSRLIGGLHLKADHTERSIFTTYEYKSAPSSVFN